MSSIKIWEIFFLARLPVAVRSLMTTVTAETKHCKKCIDILLSNVAAVQICTVRLSSLKMHRQRSLRNEDMARELIFGSLLAMLAPGCSLSIGQIYRVPGQSYVGHSEVKYKSSFYKASYLFYRKQQRKLPRFKTNVHSFCSGPGCSKAG